jgi:hypothetical protein
MGEGFDDPVNKSIGGQTGNRKRVQEAHARRAELIGYLAQGMMTKDAVEKVGVTYRTYENWRATFPQFRAQVDAVRGAKRAVDVDDHKDFIKWRKEFLGSTTTWFQAQLVEALDSNDEPGSITLVLFPPEHGKTTTVEDWITHKFCVDKNYRVTYGSEAQAHSRKALRRIRNRLEMDSPFPALISTFGPFAPIGRTSDHHGAQPWGQDFFDIYGRASGDERDYSMVALGFGSGIAGSRTDLLVGDDLISKNNVAQSEKLLDTFRQDWLSRPGTKGRTVVIGTRVEDGDMYQLMEDEGIVDHIVRFRAHDPRRIVQFDTPWLWPERYSEREYAKMRKNVGERAWARNYQQEPRLAGDSTFTEKMIDKALSPLRSVVSAPPLAAVGMVIGLDPGFGHNAIVSLAGNAERLWVLGGRVDQGLTNNQQIFEAVELQAKEHLRPGLPWLHLTIEDKAFQKGLLDDAELKALQKAYGFTHDGHQTSGLTKYDENIGIPAMARDFNRQIIDLPGADDEATQLFMDEFTSQLIRWRPHTKGTALTMDLVMAFWFGWLWWTKFKSGLQTRTNHQGPAMPALPWQPTVLPGGLTKVGR